MTTPRTVGSGVSVMFVIIPGLPRTVVSTLVFTDEFWLRGFVWLTTTVLLSVLPIARFALTLIEMLTKKAVFALKFPRENVTLLAGLGSPELNVIPEGYVSTRVTLYAAPAPV